ncbi:MAG: DUF1579 domain-containing protein [Phycisphaerales bacterium]|nr:DUF1579 domain-containing protein [Phycisphaerales bacterium]
MKRNRMFSLVGTVAVMACSAFAQQGGQPELPPGMTMEQMEACVLAATPGEMHEFLAEGTGVWKGQCTMWMTPSAEAMQSECTTTITPMMDGRFVKCETEGEMPGMGAFNGFGLYGFDNVSKSFQGTWIDSSGTGMMMGTGELNSEGDTITWTFKYNCPMTNKPAIFREVERRTGEDTMTLTMYGPAPDTGKEYKVMEIKYTRTSKTASADAGR